ncbi:uncharacterized protein LOC111636376 [Centruroides sculpturatus]|uniref:uncharacterized protein LOC111636376 n=1 Tax=Centruroides sculpturatus TaxID=218467 RepID=UPI000C6E5919|nr:uncharacterized protein LOC111636376 [Centruroides sculpturatus]
MTTPKSRDGLLFYQGRPSLFYPAVLVEEQHPHYPRTLISDLGMCKLLCSVFLLISGSVAVTSDFMNSYGTGIWAGIAVGINGILALAVGREPTNVRRWCALFVVTVVGELAIGLLIVFATVGLTRSITRRDETEDPNRRNLFITIYAVLLALALIDSVLSLICFIISIRRGIPCIKSESNIEVEKNYDKGWKDNDSVCSSSSPICKSEDVPSLVPNYVPKPEADEQEDLSSSVYKALDKYLALDYLEKSSYKNQSTKN